MFTTMYNPRFTITPKVTHDIEAIGAVFGYFRAVQLPENYKKELVSKVTAETVHSSTAIEGNTLTQQQVEDVLKGKKVTALEEDIKEVQNYNQALSFVEEVSLDKDFQVSEAFLKQIQAMLLQGIRDDVAGKYRTKQVYVGDYLPPEHIKVPNLMKEFIEWIKNPTPENLSPILYAGIIHYQFVAIHPFIDGNGRTARILITLMLIQNGYDMTRYFALESYYNRARKTYYEALSSVDKYRIDGEPDLTRWLEYFVEGMLIEAERARSKIEEILQKSRIVGQQIWLSPNQQKILTVTAQKNTAKISDYVAATGLGRGGCYKAVEKLVNMGLLKRNGDRKGAYYTITEKGLEYVK